MMILIPPAIWVVILGIIVCSREAYSVFILKNIKNSGSLFAFGYLTVAYIFIWLEPQRDAIFFQPFIRIGVTLVLLDRALTFLYEIYERRITNHGK